MTTFGERVKMIRKDAGLTQIEFGKRIGVVGSTITMIEKGDSQSTETVRMAICRTFNINPLYLSGESDVMHIPPDEDEEIIDRVLADGDPLLKALLLGIVKKPEGWRLLAESIIAAADTLREAGIELNDEKPEP